VTGSGTCVNPCSTISATVNAPTTTTALDVILLNGSTVLSQALNWPVTIVIGQANAINVTFDGVVSSFWIPAATMTFTYGIPSGADALTADAVDANNNLIIGPGNLIDPAGNILVPAAGPNATVSLNSSDATVTASALAWNPGTYLLSGTISYNGALPAGTPNANGAVVVSISPTSSASIYNFGSVPFTIFPPLYLQDTGGGVNYRFTNDPTYALTNVAYDLEVPQGANSVNVTLTANFVSPPITVQSDQCTTGAPAFITSALDTLNLAGPSPEAMPVITVNTLSGYGNCTFVLQDGGLNTATVNLAVENPQIIISRKARK
jgi:hypothetical protein